MLRNIQSLRTAFEQAQNKYAFEIIAIIVNADHFHMIIKPQDIHTYPAIISTIKRVFTKLLSIPHATNKRRECNVWQRRYWEHTIRDEEDLKKHIDYIHYNSVKHANVAPKDWPYSSFRKFVAREYYELHWCNLDDSSQIKDISME